jgi:hypothetical protein
VAADWWFAMNGNDDTPGIAAHLKESATVWDHGRSAAASTVNENFKRHGGTFFTGTRIASYTRFYCIGGLGQRTKQGENIYLHKGLNVGPPVPFSERTCVSEDAREEAFPAANTASWPAVVNTEEFLDYARALFPLQDIVSMAAYVAGGNSISPGGTILACDSAGRLYSCGQHSYAFPLSDPLQRNPLGHGPKKSQETFQAEPIPDPRRANVLQRVYGEDDDFSAIKFKQVAACRRTSFALSEDGDIYMAGDVSSFGLAADFPENSTDLPWFRKKVVSEYYDTSAALVSGSLTFTDIWAGGDVRPVLMAKDEDGRLFMCGKFVLGSLRDSPVFHEIGGFVTSVTLTHPGNYSLVNPPVITVSDPDNPYGTKPTFQILPSVFSPAGGVTAIRIVNAGWGYSSPPTITFTNSPDNNNAAATCTVFSGTWRTAGVSKTGLAGSNAGASVGTFENYAAVSEPSGELYIWGRYALWNVDPASWFGAGGFGVLDENDAVRKPGFSPRAAPEGNFSSTPISNVDEVDLGSLHGLVRQNLTSVLAFGEKASTPDSTDRPYFMSVSIPASPSSVDSIVCMSSGGAVRTIGGQGQSSGSEVLTYGLISGGQDRLGQGADGFVVDGTNGNRKINKIKGARVWARVLAGTVDGFFLLRHPVEVDEYGLITKTSDNFAFGPLPPYEAPAP